MRFDTYEDEPLEFGGTSIQGSAAPAVKWLFENGHIKPGQIVLDYGAGKYARNADFLRKNGCKVWAYDPFNFNGKEGWEEGSVSDDLPENDIFDVAFSCFVLNVVPLREERAITLRCRALAEERFHIVRNKDILEMIKKALQRQDKFVYKFYIEKFGGNQDPSEEEIVKFAKFGTQTSSGFQRLSDVEGSEVIKSTSGYKIYRD